MSVPFETNSPFWSGLYSLDVTEAQTPIGNCYAIFCVKNLTQLEPRFRWQVIQSGRVESNLTRKVLQP